LYENVGKLTLRLSLGCVILFHGLSKLGDGGSLRWIGNQLSDAGLPEIFAYGVYLGEIVAPLMIIAGVYCRIGGVIIVINMLFAVLLAHTAELLTLNEQGGYALELQVLLVFSAVAVALLGSGRFAARPD